MDWGSEPIMGGLYAVTAVVAVLTAIYTAFLFAQAKGRDFWQSPMLVLHMLVHSFMAGGAVFSLIALFTDNGANWTNFLKLFLLVSLVANLVILWAELAVSHPTEDAKAVVSMILKGRYRSIFRWGSLMLGNFLPLFLIVVLPDNAAALALASVAVLAGIYITEKIWVEAPQRISLA